jgi:catechol 2,3-dioxygenase-like lactoylglutathione lyase family enzyme
VYCTDLDEALAFYTQRLGFEVRDDVPMGPEMRWLTIHAPGDPHDLLPGVGEPDRAARQPLRRPVRQHLPRLSRRLHPRRGVHRIPPADRQAMREIVAKGDLAVFIQVDDLDKTFESLRAAGAEILQEPVDQPYGVRDAAVRDPSGNHLRLSQPLAAQG